MAHLPPTAVRRDLPCFADSKNHDNGRLCHGETPQQHQNPDTNPATTLKIKLRTAAIKSATGLFKYAIPNDDGVRFVGDGFRRLSADLWSGSAGVLLSLHGLLTATPDVLFTLDNMISDCPDATLPCVP